MLAIAAQSRYGRTYRWQPPDNTQARSLYCQRRVCTVWLHNLIAMMAARNPACLFGTLVAITTPILYRQSSGYHEPDRQGNARWKF